MVKFHLHHLALGALAALIFGLAAFSPVKNVNSDPYLSLLVAQAVLEHGTLRLDDYQAELGLNVEENYRLIQVNDHLHYVYAPGPSLLAIPAVWIFNQLGRDMRLPDDQARLQLMLAAATCALAFGLAYRLCRLYLSSWNSLLAAALFTLGSSFMSTLGAAYWNLNAATLFNLLSLWLLARQAQRQPVPGQGLWLGLALLGAFSCRPTTAVFILLVLLYLLFSDRKLLAQTAVIACAGLIIFSLYALREYGLLLPPYYLPAGLGGLHQFGPGVTTPITAALLGLWFSAGRGLFTFTPALLLTLGVSAALWRRLSQPRLAALALLWFLGHTLLVGRFWNWWGGASYGPRLLTDMLPAFVLLTALAGQQALRLRAQPRRLLLASYVALSAVGIAIHSGAGLFNPYAHLINGGPLPPQTDEEPVFLYDWRFIPPMADIDMVCARNKAYYARLLDQGQMPQPDYTWGAALGALQADNARSLRTRPWWEAAPKMRKQAALPLSGPHATFFPVILHLGRPMPAYFIGWTYQQGDVTWSACPQAAIWFWGGKPDRDVVYHLTLHARAYGTQTVHLALNDVPIGVLQFDDALSSQRLALDGALIQAEALNRLTFTLPDAAPVPNQTPLQLGLALQSLTLAPLPQ